MPQKMKEAKDKTKRRGNNEGSIYKRKQDGLWCGSVTVGYKTDGKPIRKTIYGRSRAEVAQKINAISGDVYANGYVTVSASKERNFQILVSDWFDACVAGATASTTEESRRNLLKNHIFKAFGELDIQNVDADRLQRFFNSKVKSGLAVDTVNKIKNLLNNFFVYAVKKHYVKDNPMTEVVIKKRVSSDNAEEKSKALRQGIRQQVFEWVEENPILKPIIITFSFTGLRPQELIALKWETVNLDDKTLSIKKAMNRVTKFNDDGSVKERSVKIGKTKTPMSVRTIVMPDVVVASLKEWLSYCEMNDISSEFVFPTENGAMRSYSGLRSLLSRFIKRHNLQEENITLYTFRHTFATMLLEARENPKIVASLMGHKKVSTTLDIYSHVISSDVYEETAQTLDGLYAKYTIHEE